MTAPKATIRVASFVAAAALTLGITSLLAQGLHIDRFGDGMHTVTLERVTVTAQVPAPAATVAATATAINAN